MEIDIGLVAARDDGIFYTVMIDGETFCDAMTHSYTETDGSYVPKIPNGEYTLVRGEHQLHNGPPFETFMLTPTPGHTGILIHKGNYNRDSEGCYLLGTRSEQIVDGRRQWCVSHSADAFARFMKATDGQDNIPFRISED